MDYPRPTFRVLVCSDGSYAKEPARWRTTLNQLCSRSWKGQVALWLREIDLDPEAYRALAKTVLPITNNAEVPLVLRGHVDIARELKVGTHLPSAGPSVAVARQVLGEDALIGRSCHALDDVEFCAEANYVTISPLWPTSSKEGHPGIFSQLQPVSALSPVVFGLGGVQKENLSKTLALGFYGIAARSLVWSSEEPDAVAAEILAKLSSFALP